MKQTHFFSLIVLLAFCASPLFASDHYPTPSDIVKTYFNALDGGDFTTLDQLIAEDLRATAPFAPQPLNKPAWMGVGQGFKAAFPDMKHEVLDCIESGYKVVIRGVFKGKNDGPMMGNPATGNYVNTPFTTVFELNNAWKIRVVEVQFDQKLFESQLMAGLPNQAAAAEATVRGILAAADAGDTEKLATCFHADAVHYFSGQPNSLGDFKKRVAAFKTGFPDVRREMHVLYAGNGIVTVQGWLTGTQTGPFMGKPATGNQVKVSALGYYKLDATGKVTEAWVEMDTAALQAQLNGDQLAGGK